MRRRRHSIGRDWNTQHSPPKLTVETAAQNLWRLIVFEKSEPDYWRVAEIIECDDPAYWVDRLALPVDTILHESIASYETGRARKLSSRIARIVEQKCLE